MVMKHWPAGRWRLAALIPRLNAATQFGSAPGGRDRRLRIAPIERRSTGGQDILQKDCSGNAGVTGADGCSEAAPADRKYLGRDGVHVLHNATSDAITDFSLQ